MTTMTSREIGGELDKDDNVDWSLNSDDNVDRIIDAPKCGRRTSRALHMLL